MQLHNLKRTSQRKQKKTVGRGGKRGKTSGKGGKGQTARAGHRVRPEIRDVIKKLPKLRGRGINAFKPIRQKPIIFKISDLEKFESGATVTASSFGKNKHIKILGDGTLTKKLNILGCEVSAGARKKIEALGGTIQI